VSNDRGQSVPAIRRRGPTLGEQVHNRRRGTVVDRACLHMGASGVAERSHFRHRRKFGKGQVRVDQSWRSVACALWQVPTRRRERRVGALVYGVPVGPRNPHNAAKDRRKKWGPGRSNFSRTRSRLAPWSRAVVEPPSTWTAATSRRRRSFSDTGGDACPGVSVKNKSSHCDIYHINCAS
jgi:hypothetical protein